MRARLLRIAAWGLLACVLLGGAAAAVAWSFICRADACPSVAQLGAYNPRQTTRLYAADGRFIAELGLERRTLVPLAEIPPHVQQAFVITEDKRFRRHRGIDLWRVLGAGLRNVRAGGFREGFSTITMQLARNVFPERLTREKTVLRKLREARVAVEIERRYPKDRILELYLNQIYLGNGAYGVETAAQRYFGKSVRELSLPEAAMLAALPKAPERYNPRRFPDRALQRRNTVLALLRDEGVLSDADASLAQAAPLRLARRGGGGDAAPYFADWVRRLLEERFGDSLYTAGYRVHTTLDLDLQDAAERALEAQLRAVESGTYGTFPHESYEGFITRTDAPDGADRSPYLQGAFVALDPRTGAVRALVGGRDHDDSKFDRATAALRQPGSTFKPIVYAAGIQSGRPPSYVLDDAPVEIPQVVGDTWTPQNYDLKFEGPMTMRRALLQSRNLVAIRLGMEVGEQTVVDMAQRFGISTPVPPYPSVAIGSADVFPVEMVAAYSVFATLGWHASATPIVRVEDAAGRVVWAPKTEREQVLSREEAWLMVDMLRDVVRRGTAYGAVWAQGFQLPAGGKTGTTNDGADVWFIGFTADLVAGVWMGFDAPRKIKANAQGGVLAAPAWTAFMKEAYARKPPPPDWPRPGALLSRRVDQRTGLLWGPQCPSEDAYDEWFLPGTEPVSPCPPRAPAPPTP